MTLPAASLPFSRERDLRNVIALAGRRLTASTARSCSHPGDIQWLLRNAAGGDLRMPVWYEGADLVAFVVWDHAAMPHVDPRHADVLDLIAWCEADARGRHAREAVAVAWDDDARVRDALVTSGYRETGTSEAQLVWRIAGEPPRPSLPEGFRFIAFTSAMDDEYVALHRASWSTIRPSPYRRALHDVVTSMPHFDRELVPIVAAPDGTLAAYCIGWYDPVSRWTEIEPLGTHPSFRGLGLARAVVRELVHRSWQRGAEAVMVWSTDPRSVERVNEPAFRLYTTSGMSPERSLREYRRDL